MKIYIKHMVSKRCITLVSETLRNLGLEPAYVFLGLVELPNGINMIKRDSLRRILLESGLELMEDRSTILVERATNLIHEMVHYFNEVPDVNFSDYIGEKLNCDYAYLARQFSNAKGITIQQYIIKTKIRKVKELLKYDQFSLTEISYKLRYSSVAHLSNQFKKVTGHSPAFFKEKLSTRAINQQNIGIMEYS